MASSLVLAGWLNKRQVQLDTENAGREHVGVRRKNGEYRYVCWLRFVGKDEAQRLGRSVKLEIHRIGDDSSPGMKWKDVPSGQHVQGCLTRKGAYAVIESSVRIV